MRVRRSKREPGGHDALEVTDRHVPAECKHKVIAGSTVPMHLNDEIIPIGTLLVEETGSSLRYNLNFVDARETGKFDKSIDVAVKTLDEGGSPWSTNQRNLG